MRQPLFLAVFLIGGLHASPCSPADKSPFTPGETVRVTKECLERVPLNRKSVDDAMSAKWFRTFLDDLDPKRMYFLQTDEDEFRLFERRLGELADTENFDFPRQVHRRYVERVDQAAAWAEHWIAHSHDYTKEQVYPIRFNRYASDVSELGERWRLRVKFELLIEKAHGVAVEDAQAQFRSRYRRIARDARGMTDERLCEIYLNSLAQCYDPHCEYLGPTYLSSFYISLLRPYSLGVFLRRSRGEWVIYSIDPSRLGRVGNGRDLIGWHLLAIRRVGGPVHDVQEMGIPDLARLISAHNGPLATDTQVILELVDPVAFSRKSVLWERTQG